MTSLNTSYTYCRKLGFSTISWLLGCLLLFQTLAEAATDHDIFYDISATMSDPGMPISMPTIDLDFVVSGKLTLSIVAFNLRH